MSKETDREERGGKGRGVCILWERRALCYVHLSSSYTPLMEAAREGHEDVVQLLVDHGANVNTQTEETQETALTLACCGGFLEVTQFLIEHGMCVCVCVCE